MKPTLLSEFSYVLLFIIGSLLFAIIGVFTAFMISPKRSYASKNSIYECGEESVSSSWVNFNFRFFIIAILFVLFEVEILVLFPWSLVFSDADLVQSSSYSWAYFAIFEAILFIFILFLGLIYAWKNGFLDWISSNKISEAPSKDSNMSIYHSFNSNTKL